MTNIFQASRLQRSRVDKLLGNLYDIYSDSWIFRSTVYYTLHADIVEASVLLLSTIIQLVKQDGGRDPIRPLLRSFGNSTSLQHTHTQSFAPLETKFSKILRGAYHCNSLIVLLSSNRRLRVCIAPTNKQILERSRLFCICRCTTRTRSWFHVYSVSSNSCWTLIDANLFSSAAVCSWCWTQRTRNDY